jgi:ABC-type Mn2+/Zn2+ transport system ATPase subunit
MEQKHALEAILFASGDPVSINRLAEVLEIEREDVIDCVEALELAYEKNHSGIRIVRLEDSYQMCSAPEYADIIVKTMRHRKPPRIGYVPQSPSFDPGDPVSVADLFSCCQSRRPAFLGHSAATRDKTMECLERVHGEDLIDKRIGTLSGGELQRVLLALALEPLPNILILDEPLSGVDVEGQVELMDMLDEIRRRFDLSILMTTHDFAMLPQYADKVVLIDHKILTKGTPEEVLSSQQFRDTFHRKGGAL